MKENKKENIGGDTRESMGPILTMWIWGVPMCNSGELLVELNCVPHKSLTPSTSEHDLIWKQELLQMSLVKIKTYWSRVVTWSSVTRVLIKGGRLGHGHAYRGHDVRVKTEVRVRLLQIKEPQRLPAHLQKLDKRHGTLSQKNNPTDPFILDFQPPELEIIQCHFLSYPVNGTLL